MEKINQQSFFKNLEPFIEENEVPQIDKDKINEFKIGKSYFYAVKDNNILELHNWINEYFLEKIDINSVVTSFRKKYSYLDFFEPHRNNYNFMRLDIQSFFHSVQINDIERIFAPYFENVKIMKTSEQKTLDAFINIISYKIPEDSLNTQFKAKRVLPMGFKTSPLISNIIFRQLDIQIQKLCSLKDIEYTRYADDMLFSSEKKSEFIFSETFINEIRIILNQMKFKINKSKTITFRNTLSLNGYTIEYRSGKKIINELRFSNKRLSIINKLIYMKSIKKIKPKVILKKLFQFQFDLNKFKFPIKDSKTISKYYNDQLKNKVTGYRSYLLSLVKFNKKHQCTTEKTIDKYIKLIKDLDDIINELS